MLAAIILFVSLVAIVVGIVAYRLWFLRRVEYLNLELTHLDLELDRGAQAAIERRDVQQQLTAAVAAFNYADLTAKKVERLLKDRYQIPVPALPALVVQGTVVMEELGGIARVLHTHSSEIAGVQQVLLNLQPLPDSEVFGQITLAYFSGLFPAGLQENAGRIVEQLAQGLLDDIASLESVATELLHNLTLMYVADPSEIASLAEPLAPGQDILAHLLDPLHLQVYLSTLSSLSNPLLSQDRLNNEATPMTVPPTPTEDTPTTVEQLADIGIDHLTYVTSFEAHFPSITAAISVSRDIALLQESHAHVGTSQENASLADGLSNQVQEKPFEEAEEQLEAAISTLQREGTAVAYQALKQVRRTASEKKMRLIHQMEARPRPTKWERWPLVADVSDLQTQASLFLQQARMLINRAQKYTIIPGTATLSKHLVQVEEKVRRAESTLPAATLLQTKPLAVLESLSSMPIPLPGYSEWIKEATHTAEQATTQCRKEMTTWSCQVMGAYLPVAHDIKQVIESAGQEYQRTCEDLIAQVNEASTSVKTEAETLSRVRGKLWRVPHRPSGAIGLG